MHLPASMGDSVDVVPANFPETKPLPLFADNKCQNLSSPESGALLSCMQSVMEGGPVNASTEVSDRVRTVEMKIDPALGTSIRPFPSATITRQLTEPTSTSDSAEPLTRSCLPDTASDEEEEINFRPGKPLTEGIDKNVKSDMESSAT
jgi:hypothetical protein